MLLRTLAIILFGIFMLGAIAKAVTIEEREGELVEVPTKKLVHPRLVSVTRRIVERGIPLKWQDGSRKFLSHDLNASDDLDIKRMKFVAGVVVEIEVINNIIYSESDGSKSSELRARCEVFLEKEQGRFHSNYFLCVNEHGEEIEYER